jgi:hypothetical protein
VPHLSEEQRTVALATATDYARTNALAGLAPAAQALAAATVITDDNYRANTLAGLAPHLPLDPPT